MGAVKMLTFLLNRWIKLNFGLSHRAYFSLWNGSLRAKIGVKTNEISSKYQNPNRKLQFFFFLENYTLPTYGFPEKHFAYLWFENWYFTHLKLAPFVFRYPLLLKTRVNLYFYYPFMSLLSKKKNNK